jgi:hypothetical protein
MSISGYDSVQGVKKIYGLQGGYSTHLNEGKFAVRVCSEINACLDIAEKMSG